MGGGVTFPSPRGRSALVFVARRAALWCAPCILGFVLRGLCSVLPWLCLGAPAMILRDRLCSLGLFRCGAWLCCGCFVADPCGLLELLLGCSCDDPARVLFLLYRGTGFVLASLCAAALCFLCFVSSRFNFFFQTLVFSLFSFRFLSLDTVKAR